MNDAIEPLTMRRPCKAAAQRRELQRAPCSWELGSVGASVVAARPFRRTAPNGERRTVPRYTTIQMALKGTVVLPLLLLLLAHCYVSVAGFASPALHARGGVVGSGGNGAEAAASVGRSGSGDQGGEAPSYARSPPRDGVLYDELEVHWGASSREIKKAYYRLAVMHHPDKKPGDSHSEDRFKRVSEAYQILQDEATRERYHKKGVASLEEDGQSWGGGGDGVSEGWGTGVGGGGEQRRRIDSMEVFRMFLGGGMFEHLIGPLSPRMVPVVDPDYHHQKARALAEDLERRLEVHVKGNLYWFDQTAWAEALQLREQSMGREILRTVGYVYKNYALRSLGKLAPNILQLQAIRGKMKYVSDKAHRMNNLLAAVSSTTRLYVHLQTRKPDDALAGSWGGPGQRSPSSAQEEETVSIVMEALWRVHRVDVEHTVQQACKMVLRDPRVPPSVLKKRAEALMRLGHIFSAASKGEYPESGVFHFVEHAPSTDPFAGTATFTSPFSDSPECGSDYSTGAAAGDGWDAAPTSSDGGRGQNNVGWQTMTAVSSVDRVAVDSDKAFESAEPPPQRGTDRDSIGIEERGGAGQGLGGIVKGELARGFDTETVYASSDMNRRVGTRGGNVGRDFALSFQSDGDGRSGGGDRASGGVNSGGGFNGQAQRVGQNEGRAVYRDRFSKTPAGIGSAPSAAAGRARAICHEAERRKDGVLCGDGWREAAAPSEPVSNRAAGTGENCVEDQTPGSDSGLGAGGHLEGSGTTSSAESVVATPTDGSPLQPETSLSSGDETGNAVTAKHAGRSDWREYSDGIMSNPYGGSSKQETRIPPVEPGSGNGAEGDKRHLPWEQSCSWTSQGRQDPGLERRSEGERWRDR